MSKFGKTITIFSAICLFVFTIFVLLLNWFSPALDEEKLLLMVISYCCGMVPLALLSSIWLVWVNRVYVSNVFVWTLFQVLFVASIKLYTSPNSGFIFSSILLILFPLLGLVNFLYIYQRGYSLRFMGWSSVFFMWSILAAWRITGNLLEVWMKNMFAQSNDLWWLYSAMYGAAWAFVAGFISFIVETIVVIQKELAAG